MLQIPHLKDSPSEINTLKRVLSKIVSKELSNLTQPCYKTNMAQYMSELKSALGIDKSDVKTFYESLEKQYIRKFGIITNEITSIIFLAIIFYARRRNNDIVQTLYYLLAIRFHVNVVSKHFQRYCKEDIWETALEEIYYKHLFKVRGGISNTLVYLANEEFRKRYSTLQRESMTEAQLLDFVYALRSRIRQSMESFAQRYYKIDEEKRRTITGQTDEDSVIDDIQKLSENLANSICSYKQVDRTALNEAMSSSRISRDIASKIITDLSTVKYKEQLKFLIVLIDRTEKLKNLCVTSKRNLTVRRIIQNRQRIRNYSIYDEIMKIVKDLPIYKNISSTNESTLVSFFISYLLNYVKNKIC